MYIKDLSSRVYAPALHRDAQTRSVGWLGNNIRVVGKTDNRVIEFLKHKINSNQKYDGDLGFHVCELCGEYKSQGEIWIENNNIRYVLPAMIVHYIEKHSYKMPKEVEDLIEYKITQQDDTGMRTP